MRCTQLMGLSLRAEGWLENNVEYKATSCGCPHCSTAHVKSPRMEEYASAAHYGMFDDGPELNKYYCIGDAEVVEAVQEVIWSSGPCIFLTLKLWDNKSTEWVAMPSLDWTAEEMRKAT